MIAADTGFLVALFHDKDNAHQSATSFLQDTIRQKKTLLTTGPVITELFHLLKNREKIGDQTLRAVMSSIQAFNISIVSSLNEDEIFAEWVKYINQPNRMVDFTDFHLFLTGLQYLCDTIVATDSKDHNELNTSIPRLFSAKQMTVSGLLRTSYPFQNIKILQRT